MSHENFKERFEENFKQYIEAKDKLIKILQDYSNVNPIYMNAFENLNTSVLDFIENYFGKKKILKCLVRDGYCGSRDDYLHLFQRFKGIKLHPKYHKLPLRVCYYDIEDQLLEEDLFPFDINVLDKYRLDSVIRYPNIVEYLTRDGIRISDLESIISLHCCKSYKLYFERVLMEDVNLMEKILSLSRDQQKDSIKLFLDLDMLSYAQTVFTNIDICDNYEINTEVFSDNSRFIIKSKEFFNVKGYIKVIKDIIVLPLDNDSDMFSSMLNMKYDLIRDTKQLAMNQYFGEEISKRVLSSSFRQGISDFYRSHVKNNDTKTIIFISIPRDQCDNISNLVLQNLVLQNLVLQMTAHIDPSLSNIISLRFHVVEIIDT